jgi:hypothetical protein
MDQWFMECDHSSRPKGIHQTSLRGVKSTLEVTEIWLFELVIKCEKKNIIPKDIIYNPDILCSSAWNQNDDG